MFYSVMYVANIFYKYLKTILKKDFIIIIIIILMLNALLI